MKPSPLVKLSASSASIVAAAATGTTADSACYYSRSLQSAGAGQLVAGITASAGAVHQAASSTASAGAEHLAASSTASAGAGHLAADSMSSTAEVPGCSGPMWSLPERRHCAARCRQPCGSRAAFSSS